MRPPLRVRLAVGEWLPVPPNEGVDGDMSISRGAVIRVRDSSWARRRIARGDLEIVRETTPTRAPAVDDPGLFIDLDSMDATED